jgi:hypothetical protein
MFADLRVPVERASVEVLLSDGTRHSLVVFQAPGQGLESFAEAPEPFFPAHEQERLRLFARANIVALSGERRASRLPGEDDLPETQRTVRVHVASGEILEGDLRFIACEGSLRPVDHLNESSRSFPLFTTGRVHHIVKAHVLFVEELT